MALWTHAFAANASAPPVRPLVAQLLGEEVDGIVGAGERRGVEQAPVVEQRGRLEVGAVMRVALDDARGDEGDLLVDAGNVERDDRVSERVHAGIDACAESRAAR